MTVTSPLPYTFEVTVPGRSPSGNVVQRWHWHQRQRWTIATYQAIKVAMLTSRVQKPPKPLKRARVEITSIRSRLLDHDRLYGGLTAYLDALQPDRVHWPKQKGARPRSKPGLGIIASDAPEVVDYAARQRVGFPERVIIAVRELGD